MLPDPSPR